MTDKYRQAKVRTIDRGNTTGYMILANGRDGGIIESVDSISIDGEMGILFDSVDEVQFTDRVTIEFTEHADAVVDGEERTYTEAEISAMTFKV